jgi:hypothetical protein
MTVNAIGDVQARTDLDVGLRVMLGEQGTGHQNQRPESSAPHSYTCLSIINRLRARTAKRRHHTAPAEKIQ